MIRTGLIGYGLGGLAFHAPLITAEPGLALAAVATSRAEAVHARYPAAAVTDADALLADPTIGLVAISTPNHTHFPLARAALLAGKHVVIDKPFATSIAEADVLAEMAAARGLVLSAFHNRRWDGDFLTVRRLIESGRLGQPTLFEGRWDRYRPAIAEVWKERPEAGAGILADLGPHLIDQALLLFGMPDALSADIAIQRKGGRVDDYFELTLSYGRCRVVLSAGRLVVSPRPRFAVHGTSGNFYKHGLDPQEVFLKDGGSTDDPRFGVEDAANHGVLTMADGTRETIATERGDYRHFYAGVVRAITAGAPPPVSAGDARAGMKLAELARESASSGRRIGL
jgi:scyllo-inositol 2-dehydrogenase (NADP+)